jgi:hypothetical protein
MRLCRYIAGKRLASSVRCCSSITMMRSAWDSCLSVIGLSLYSPAEAVVNLSENISAAVLLLLPPSLQRKRTCMGR